MILLLALHAVVGGALLAAARAVRGVFVIAAVPFLAAIGFAAWSTPAVLDGDTLTARLSWVAGLELGIGLRLDGFALLMVLVVAGIGIAVMAYSASYFEAPPVRTAGLLVLFGGSMLGIVLADDVLFLYVCWELTSLTSYLLIGSHHEDHEARDAARHALLVTSAGGLALLCGVVVLAQEAGTTSLTGILDARPSGVAAGVGLGLVVIGIVTKSAQYPVHAWLPGAMVAPTPISAYLHSATMVKAGLVVAARFAPAFASAPAWRPAVVGIGLLTMLAGGLRALRQHDLKLLLAMGTVSQLGFLLVLLGAGVPEATVAGCTLLLAHALFKATLFLVVGEIDHQAGTRDRRQLAGLGPGWRGAQAGAVVACASTVGLPPLIGYVAKEAAFEAFVHEDRWGAVVLAGLVAGSALTVAYTVRLLRTLLARPAPGTAGVPPPPWRFSAPAVALSALTAAAGLAVTPLVDPLVGAAAASLDAGAEADLALWHGFGPPVVASLVTFAVGAALAVGRGTVDATLRRLTPPAGAAEAYRAVVHGLEGVARGTTRLVQNGSLPVAVTLVLLTAVALPGAAALGTAWPGWPRFSADPAQAAMALAVGVAAVATAVTRRRFAAAVLLGVVGYGMALIFVIQGAPDLALTQFAIETLTVVVFVLVLRILPSRFAPLRRSAGLWWRAAVSAVVGLAVFGFVLLTAGLPRGTPVGRTLAARSAEETGGRNVVNVILVDIRGMDTLGEITVLAVAALGVIGLARAGRRSP